MYMELTPFLVLTVTATIHTLLRRMEAKSTRVGAEAKQTLQAGVVTEVYEGKRRD